MAEHATDRGPTCLPGPALRVSIGIGSGHGTITLAIHLKDLQPVPMIQVDSLVKEFHRPKRFDGPLGGLRTLVTQQHETTRAVDGVSFTVDEGELIGYLGSNGAGKSTTIKMLSGILVPTSGTVTVGGLVPWEQRERNALQIGVVFGQRTQLWWDLPLGDSLKLIGKLYRVDATRYQRNLERLVDLLGLDEFLDRPVRQLSLGQRMRGDLAAAMLYEPRVLYLDEPTVGLDAVAKERMRTFIEEINRERRTTVLLTTHDLADVQKLCPRVLIIDHGKLLYDGALTTLQTRFGGHWQLTVDFAEAYPDVSLEGAELLHVADQRAVYAFDRQALSASDLIGLLSARFNLRDVSVAEPDAETTIRRIYEQKLLHGLAVEADKST